MATSTWLIDWPTLDPGVVRSLQTWKAAAYKMDIADEKMKVVSESVHRLIQSISSGLEKESLDSFLATAQNELSLKKLAGVSMEFDYPCVFTGSPHSDGATFAENHLRMIDRLKNRSPNDWI